MSNNNNNNDDESYQSKIDKLVINEKLVKESVDSFHMKTNEKVKSIVRTANKLLELQVSLSRCCEWLNELVDKNRETSEDPDIDPACISKIEALLDEGVYLGDIFDGKLQDIKACVERMEPLWDSLENARLIIHNCILAMPKLDITRLPQRAKDYEIKTNEYSSKKRPKTKAKKNSPKQPINDFDFQSTNNNNSSSSIINVEDSHSNDNDEIDIDTRQSYGEIVSKDNKENRKRPSSEMVIDYNLMLDKHYEKEVKMNQQNEREVKMRKLDKEDLNNIDDDDYEEEEAPDDDNEEYVKDTTNISVSIQMNSPNSSQNIDSSVIDLTE